MKATGIHNIKKYSNHRNTVHVIKNNSDNMDSHDKKTWCSFPSFKKNKGPDLKPVKMLFSLVLLGMSSSNL